jgi:hypothetical protein
MIPHRSRDSIAQGQGAKIFGDNARVKAIGGSLEFTLENIGYFHDIHIGALQKILIFFPLLHSDQLQPGEV